MEQSLFLTLYGINVNDKVEKKNGLSYVSWPFAWAEVKKIVPDATYTIYERETEYGPVNYFTDGRTCWVKTGVTLNGLEHIEELPVMDFKNRSIAADAVTSMDVNKAIQRSLTKACARHGLGLYIYAGDDLPDGESEPRQKDDIPARGSQQAAQEAGKKKLEELAKSAEKPSSGPTMAAPGQIEYIKENADDETYLKAMQAFGTNLENMTAKQAEKLIDRIQKAG